MNWAWIVRIYRIRAYQHIDICGNGLIESTAPTELQIFTRLGASVTGCGQQRMEFSDKKKKIYVYIHCKPIFFAHKNSIFCCLHSNKSLEAACCFHRFTLICVGYVPFYTIQYSMLETFDALMVFKWDSMTPYFANRS